eukprot:469630-Lingulodinium_polyedra.AAC.1
MANAVPDREAGLVLVPCKAGLSLLVHCASGQQVALEATEVSIKFTAAGWAAVQLPSGPVWAKTFFEKVLAKNSAGELVLIDKTTKEMQEVKNEQVMMDFRYTSTAWAVPLAADGPLKINIFRARLSLAGMGVWWTLRDVQARLENCKLRHALACG